MRKKNIVAKTCSRRAKTGIAVALMVVEVVLISSFFGGGFSRTVQAYPGPDPQWKQNYGGSLFDEKAYSVIQTTDGGYMLAGTNYSYPYPPTGTHALLVKTDSSGNMQWNGTYPGGGNDEDYVRSVVQTADGGYVFAGYTRGPTYPSLTFYSWLVKTDSAGNVLWNSIYTLPGQNYAYSMVKTNDGGFALAGQSSSSGAMLLRTNSAGNFLWFQTYGAGLANSVVQTSDGGFALAGSALWKTDSAGNLQWSKPLAASEANAAYSIVQTSDGGYAYAGDKGSLQIGNDIFLAKTDSNGNWMWNGTYGGSKDDACYSLVQTSDGGYALAGRTKSYGAGNWDGYLIKTDSIGVQQWWDYFGGALDDGLYCVVKTSDGALALAGYTKSYTNGGYDMWLIKVSVSASTPLVIESCDSAGMQKDIYSETETVYVSGSGYLPTSMCTVYVVEDTTWTDGKSITPGSVTLTTTWSDATGHITAAPVYYPPLVPGKYDIVVDVNDNGLYDVGIDAIDNNDIEVTAGFVVPEFPPSLTVPLFMLATVLAIALKKKLTR